MLFIVVLIFSGSNINSWRKPLSWSERTSFMYFSQHWGWWFREGLYYGEWRCLEKITRLYGKYSVNFIFSYTTVISVALRIALLLQGTGYVPGLRIAEIPLDMEARSKYRYYQNKQLETSSLKRADLCSWLWCHDIFLKLVLPTNSKFSLG